MSAPAAPSGGSGLLAERGAISPSPDEGGAVALAPVDWPLWEVFVRSRRGLAHTHAGSLHAPDARMALRNARDLFTRRMEGVSIWVVPSAAITASSPDEKDAFFDPAADKAYRHPSFYEIPDGVTNL
jgi:ring-1,2-phenylacetyl-CoA epoxidase subunit PaaB